MEETDQGFLITCDKHKQKNAIKQAYNFLSEYIEDIYGDLEDQLIQKQLTQQGKQHNLQNQLKALNNAKKNKILSTTQTKVNCLIFIKINKQYPNIDPYAIVMKLMEDIHKNQKQVTRFCHKIMPVQNAFKAEHFKMLDIIRQMFTKRDNSQMKSWALNFKCRNNSKFNYKQILGETQQIAKEYGHFVDIYFPQWTVSIQIANHLMCLSIIEKYKDYQQYRLHKKAPNMKALAGVNNKAQNKQKVQNKQKAQKTKKQRLTWKKQQKNKEIAQNDQIPEKQQQLKKQQVSELQKDFNKESVDNKLLLQKIQIDDDQDVDFI